MVAIDILSRSGTQNELSCDNVYEAMWLAASRPVYIFQPMKKRLMDYLLMFPRLLHNPRIPDLLYPRYARASLRSSAHSLIFGLVKLYKGFTIH